MTKNHPISLFMFAVLIASMLSCCESAKAPQATEPVNEKTTLDRGDTKETKVATLIPPPITPDIDDQPSKPTMPPAHPSPTKISPENEQVPVGKNAVKQSNHQANMSAAGKRTKSARAVIPKKLRGIWSDNDADGKLKCEQYRLAIRHDRKDEGDELSNSLVGSLVITRHMIHAYAEYGEGDFYLIKNVTPTGRDEWKIDSHVYVDTFPSEEDEGDEEMFTFRLDLTSKLLFWRNYDSKKIHEIANDESPGFFRCGQLTKQISAGYGDN